MNFQKTSRNSGNAVVNSRLRFFFCLAILASLTGAAAVDAHRVMVFAWVEGSQVITESSFPGGKAVHQGKITVYDSEGNPVLSGKTDAQGRFSFDLRDLSVTGPLTIVLNAGMGHRNEWTLSAEELGRKSIRNGGIPESQRDFPEPGKNTFQYAEAAETGEFALGMRRQEVEAMVEAVVRREMAPVMKTLLTIRDEMVVGVDDVFAGLGYILGLVGLAAYFSARRKR